MNHLKPFLVALGSFVILDGIWLGLVMAGFYRQALGPLARLGPDGSLAPLWLVAAPVYVLLALGQVWFVLPRAAEGGIGTAAVLGALFGLVVYGVYDLTNWSTLRGYTATLALVDIAWGMFACATVSLVVRTLGR